MSLLGSATMMGGGGGVSAVGISNTIANKSNCKIVYPGDNFKTVYGWLAHADRDASMGAKTNTNRRTLVLMPGLYPSGSTETGLQLIEYVDIVGVGMPTIADTLLASPATPTIYLPEKSADEVGITNIIESLQIIGGGAAFAAKSAANRKVVRLNNCIVDAITDVIYLSGSDARNYTIDIFNSKLTSRWDVIACISAQNNIIRTFNSDLIAEFKEDRISSQVNTTGTTIVVKTIGVGCSNNELYFYNSYLSAKSDNSARENFNARSQCIASERVDNLYYVSGGSLVSHAVKHAGGTTETGHSIFCSDGAVEIVGTKFLGATGGDEINQTGGTVSQRQADYNPANVTGTVLTLHDKGIPSADATDGVTVWNDSGTLKVSSSV